MLASESDLAKFPFTVEASSYVRSRGIDIGKLTSPEYSQIVDRAVKRIEEALRDGVVHTKWRAFDDHVEILSYPVSIMIVAAIGDRFLGKRYALAEAKRAYELLTAEISHKLKEYVFTIGTTTLGWDIHRIEEGIYGKTYDFALSVSDFLRNITHFKADKWKLVNRLLIGGYVYLTSKEVARLIQEEIMRRIENKVEERLKFELPSPILKKIDPLRVLIAQRCGEVDIKAKVEGFLIQAFPPCIKHLYDDISSGRRLSHLGRFVLTSFLLNVGMRSDEIVDLFTQSADFDQRKTRYQVEHIAGIKGSRTKYISPNCGTLKTHGLCVGADELCKPVRHPLSYYRKKMRNLRKGVE